MTASTTVQVGSTAYLIERASARKASRALALLRQLTSEAPELQKRWSTFTTEFERDNVMTLDRVQARIRFPAEPIVDQNGVPALGPDGQPLMAPSRLDAMSEYDWDRAGQVFTIPRSPSFAQQAAAVFGYALEVAEENVYDLLALFTLSNAEVKNYRQAGNLQEKVRERADLLLDEGYADQLMELAVVCGEAVDDQFRTKADELGDRVGKALTLVGLGHLAKKNRTPASPAPSESTSGPSDWKPTSSTDTPAPTPDGDPTRSSTPPGTSSSSSASESTPTRSQNELPEPMPEPEPGVMAR